MPQKHVHSYPVIALATFFTVMSILVGSFYFSIGVTPAYAFQNFNVHYISKSHLSYTLASAANLFDKDSQSVQFSCQASNAIPHCYAPAQIRQAYNIQALLNKHIDGTGKKIIIIDAYQSPTLTSDLHMFDKLFTMPDPQVTVVAPEGLTPFNPNDQNQVGWAAEITLDVEWAHAIAPGAGIVLVLAKTSTDADLLAVTKYAVDNNLGDVLSQSFGEGETCADPKMLKAEHAVFQEATTKGITLFAASGDSGAAQPTCNNNSYYLSASTPASDTLVTGVGGTSLNANTAGAYVSEKAWNDQLGASGGGISVLYKHPAYQNAVNLYGHTGRGVPDVSYDADVNSGVLVVLTMSGQQAVYDFGGTSAGSPQWAAIVALADQVNKGRIGFINGGLYALGAGSAYHTDFYDITSGNNTFTGTTPNGNSITVTGYNTRTAWDAVTGWGSPNVANLILGKQNIITAAKANPAKGL